MWFISLHQCEPLMGFGFRRGGYQCVCNPGYYYPWWHDGPFLGVEMEEATREEYELGFDCLTIQGMLIWAFLRRQNLFGQDFSVRFIYYSIVLYTSVVDKNLLIHRF